MAERNAGAPPEKRIEFRVGINLGDVIANGEDIFGDGVNIAARLEALAAPGGIVVSAVVRDQTRDKLDVALEDIGEQQVNSPTYLPGVPPPVHAGVFDLGRYPPSHRPTPATASAAFLEPP